MPEKVHEEFKIAARLLRRGADLLHGPWEDGKQAIYPGSEAEAEVLDTTFDDGWGRATYEAAHQATAQTIVAYDHLHAMAGVLTTPQTALSLSTLARTALVAFGLLNYLYEPGIDTRERVRRWANMRLVQLVEQRNLIRGVASSADAVTTAREALGNTGARLFSMQRSAERFGFRHVETANRNVPQRSRYLDTRIPSDQRLIADLLLLTEGDDVVLGPALHRLMSASAHAQAHGLFLYMLDRGEGGTTEGTVNVRFGVGAQHLTMLVGAALLGCSRTGSRLAEYYGWPRAPWETYHRDAVEAHRRWRNY